MMELIDRSAIPNYAIWGTMTVGDMKQPAKMRIVLWNDLMAMPVVNTDNLVIHGKWEFVEHFAPYLKCSQCSFEYPMVASEQETESNLFPYCPNCGAKMDMKP